MSMQVSIPGSMIFFNKAMGNITTIIMKRVLECYKGFEHMDTIVDVGGGLGITLKLITSKHSHIQGVNFDLPHVIENAQTYPGIFCDILMKNKS